MDLSPYPNLHKAEKIKSTLRILQKDFYSFYLTHQICHKKRKECVLSGGVGKISKTNSPGERGEGGLKKK